MVDRCGVIAGPWQMGKVDQGVFTYGIVTHRLGRPLRYIGFGGTGKQVRDLLHVADLTDLIERQLAEPAHWDGHVVNVGGGRQGSLTLRETTALCSEITGNVVEVQRSAETRPGDLPLYVSDCTRLYSLTDWRPRRGPRKILADIDAWVREHETELAGAIQRRSPCRRSPHPQAQAQRQDRAL